VIKPSSRALLLLTLYAAALEIPSTLLARSHVASEDFLFSALGILMGAVAARTFKRLRPI
jgi:hypothetical protein